MGGFLKGVLIIVIVLLIVVGGWAAFVYVTGFTFDFPGTPPDIAPQTAEASQLPVGTTPRSIAIRHTSDGSVHTYSGTMTLPACEQISSGVQVVGTDAPQVDVLLEGTLVPACTDTAQAPQDFSVSVGVASGASPVFGKVYFNGAEIPHTMVE